MQKYHFLYDNFGNTTSIGIGGWNSEEQITLASYEYAAMNGLLTKQTYGNGDKVEFTYDILGRAKTTTYKDENNNVDRVLTYVYTGDGQMYSIHDSRTGFLYLYTYDSIGRLIGSSVKNADGEVLMSTRQEYNANNQLVGQHWTVGSTTYSETYTYSTVDGALTSYNNALGETVNLEYDALRRISKMDTTTLDRFYEYADGKESGQTTGLVSRYWYHTANYDDAYYKYNYSYDALGNISSYTQSDTTYTYTYDDQNQLRTQTGGGKTYTYTYDNAGNILTASNGTTTNSYTYGNALWKDQLTAFNGQTITYDGSGNPLSYYNGKSYTFTWEEGRNLVSAVEGTNTYTYAYDSNGLRTSKVENGKAHTYLYASGRLLRETITYTEDGEQVVEILDFVYDHSGHPFALRYTADGTTTNYYYITNLQGDVLALITGSGQSVASYSYDPYGKVLSASGSMAEITPLRYRGYYYDTETGFYYLQSRYYDPSICRFVNSDTQFDGNAGLNGYNLFAYCANNPGKYKDISGEGIILACIITFGVIGAAIGGYIAAKESENQLGYVNGWWVFAGVLAGGGTGCLIGWGVGAAAAAIGAALTAGSGGTLGATIYANWQAAEQALRNLMNSVSSQAARTFQTPWGNRIVDAYNSAKRIIAEAKYGYQGLSEFIKTEIARDAWLLETGKVKAVEWHFYVSQVTGKGGPSAPLLKALLEAGIKVIFH